jgi:hypothetical protein
VVRHRRHRLVVVGAVVTPEELREKVARAMFAATVNDAEHIRGFLSFEEQSGYLQTHYRMQADAAIAAVREAMREPNAEMVTAAYRTVGHSRSAAAIWQSMLAASPLGGDAP